jgi:hypothetical protein
MEGQANAANRAGFYSAIGLAVITFITFGLAMTAIPISGANAPGGGLPYPYLDTLKQFPKDYFWMFAALVLIIAYMIYMVSLHSSTGAERKLPSRIGTVFAIISAVVLLANYFIQIAVVPVSLINDQTAGISLVTQYNPHGIFIAMEELGYIMMSISFLFIAFAFGKNGRLEAVIKWIFLLAFILTVISLAIISIQYGIDRQDRFEVIVISICWLTLIINGILSSVLFGKRLKAT